MRIKRWKNITVQLIGAKCDIVHVDCCVCGRKQIKKDNPNRDERYKITCTKCIRTRKNGKNATKEVACYKCGLMHIAKVSSSQCDGCKDDMIREKRRQYRQARKGKPRTDQHRKRARLYGAKYEPINKIKVFERDGYKCYLCSIDVVVSKTYRKDQATIDHVIAMANGGDHTYSNVKTCCHACNSRKGDAWIDQPIPPLLFDSITTNVAVA